MLLNLLVYKGDRPIIVVVCMLCTRLRCYSWYLVGFDLGIRSRGLCCCHEGIAIKWQRIKRSAC